MYTLEKIKNQIIKEINKALGREIVSASDLSYPPDAGMGDLSLPCFKAGKEMKKPPVEVASKLLGELSSPKVLGELSSLKIAGPYLNFTLKKEKLADGVLKEITKMKSVYGENKDGRKKRVSIEYSNANTHKEYHVGHLRNICYGDAAAKILSANGFEVVPISYINDFGIHTAKTLWLYLEKYKDEPQPENKGAFLGRIYAEASQRLEKDQIGRQVAAGIMKKIESRQGEEYKLWQKTRKWSIKQFDNIYKELGVKFKKIFYESEFTDEGLEMIAKMYKKEILAKSEGAIIADLEKYGLGVLVFLRSDGTALYPVADLPAAIDRIKKFRLDKSLYVVDIRQSLYFKQLFKILELLGHKEDKEHLGYEFVKLPEGMMSSRAGRVITYEELKEEAIKRAVKETKSRHKDWGEKKIKSTAWTIVKGAIKFEMIKVGAGSVITFDIDKALRFDGFTAAYLQYTCARIRSVAKKAGVQGKPDPAFLKEEKEASLIMKLSKYPESVQKAGAGRDPSEIARYLFDLAQTFNDYYHSVPVLKSSDKEKAARLALLAAVRQVIKNGLGLLGIDVLEEM